MFTIWPFFCEFDCESGVIHIIGFDINTTQRTLSPIKSKADNKETKPAAAQEKPNVTAAADAVWVTNLAAAVSAPSQPPEPFQLLLLLPPPPLLTRNSVVVGSTSSSSARSTGARLRHGQQLHRARNENQAENTEQRHQYRSPHAVDVYWKTHMSISRWLISLNILLSLKRFITMYKIKLCNPRSSDPENRSGKPRDSWKVPS